MKLVPPTTKLETYYGDGQRLEVAEIVLPRTRSVLRVLEVGCGNGQFRRNFHPDCEYWGVDPNPQVATKASEVLTNFLFGSFEDVYHRLPLKYFDMVVLNDVLEHMAEPNSFLVEIQKYINANGLIVGSLPNVRFSDNIYRFLVLRDWKYSEQGILDSGHLRFFTYKSIERMFTELDFEIQVLRGVGKPVIEISSLRNFFYTIGLNVIPLVFGGDTKYLQFVFRVKPLFSRP